MPIILDSRSLRCLPTENQMKMITAELAACDIMVDVVKSKVSDDVVHTIAWRDESSIDATVRHSVGEMDKIIAAMCCTHQQGVMDEAILGYHCAEKPAMVPSDIIVGALHAMHPKRPKDAAVLWLSVGGEITGTVSQQMIEFTAGTLGHRIIVNYIYRKDSKYNIVVSLDR